MDRLLEIGSIVDDCLTTKTLNRLYPPERVLEEKSLPEMERLNRNHLLHIELLEMAGKALRGRFDQPLTEGEVVFVCRRLETFLMAHGFEVLNSTSKCNTLTKDLLRRFETKALARTMV